MTGKFSLAITHYGNRVADIDRLLRANGKHSSLAEVVIVDDASPEADYRALQATVQSTDYGTLLRLYRNQFNLFMFRNKIEAVQRCSSEWVILFDSDNFFDATYLDVLSACDLQHDCVYVPEFARPSFDYRAYAGKSYGRDNIRELEKCIGDSAFRCMLNTMNCLFHRDSFIAAMQTAEDYDPFVSDSLWINYLMLRNRNRLFVVPGLQYQHKVHVGSTWRQRHGERPSNEQYILKLITSL